MEEKIEKMEKKNYVKYIFLASFIISFLFISKILAITILIFYIWRYTDSKKGVKTILTLLVLSPLLYFLLIFLGFAPFRTYAVNGDSMTPNFATKQRLITTSFYKDIYRGDVVVYQSQAFDGKSLIKRVIGLPNETVGLVGGKITINGKVLDESGYLKNSVTVSGKILKENGSLKLTSDQYFVMSDKRDKASDSRDFGPVKKTDIEGKFWMKY